MTERRKVLKKEIEKELMKTIPFEYLNEHICFNTKTPSGGYIRLDTIGGDMNCIVVEFAENKKEAENNRFEDGDLLYLEDMTKNQMIEKVIENINE